MAWTTEEPTNWIAGWTEDGTDVTFPIASIPELTAAEADAVTGDIRNILFAMLEQMYQVWAALDSADRPANMTISKSSSLNATTGVVVNSYSVRFNCEISGQEVTDEA